LLLSSSQLAVLVCRHNLLHHQPNNQSTAHRQALLLGIVAVAVVGQNLYYTVQSGETLWSIAFNYYGTMDTAVINAIARTNADILRPVHNVPQAGMVLVLPAQVGNRSLINPTTAQETSPQGFYMVRAGDTLGSIAQRLFGDRAQWTRIAEANRDRVSNPNLIREGQWLVIPQ
jgi:nucleoid-associated protein YgaU